MTNFYLKRQGARIMDNRLKDFRRTHLFLGKKEKYLSSDLAFLDTSHRLRKKTSKNNSSL